MRPVHLVSAALLAITALTTYRLLSPFLDSSRPRSIGDGQHVASYGFALEPCLVPPATIVPSGLPRDGLSALDRPRLWRSAAIDSLRAVNRRRKFLVPDDLVLSVTVGGATRAYPLRVLQWHEVALDTLGGRPIAVVHSPLAGLSTAFDLEARPTGLRMSGLLHASAVLLYDPEDGSEGTASLWSPLQTRAITGPAAARGESLAVLPSEVLPWRVWELRHPAGTVVRPEDTFADRYRRSPYGNYLGDDRLRFSVAPLPPRERTPWKTPALVLFGRNECVCLSLPALVSRAGAEGRTTIHFAGQELSLAVSAEPLAAWIDEPSESESREVQSLRAFWFAWYATHPDAVLDE